MRKECLLIILLILLISCAPQRHFIEDWPTYQYGHSRTGFVPDGPTPPLEVAWIFETTGRILYAPTIREGIVYFGSRDGNIYAVSAETGGEIWKYPIGQGGIYQSSTLWGDRLYAGKWTPYYFIYAIERMGGQLLWQRQTGELVNREPWVSVDQERLYFNIDPPIEDEKHQSVMTAMFHDSKELLWQRPLPGIIEAAPALSENLILVTTIEPSMLYALQKENGEILWEYPAPGPIYSAPIVQNNRVFLATENGFIHTLNLENGKLIWRYELQGVRIRSDMALADNFLLIPGEQRNLYAFELTNLEPGWKFPSYKQLAPPIATPQYVYIGGEDQYFNVLDRQSGRPLWRYRTGGMLLGAPAIYKDMVFIGSTDGKLYAFREPIEKK